MNRRPTAVITLGDSCGIGPEVILKGLTTALKKKSFVPIILGDRRLCESKYLNKYFEPMELEILNYPVPDSYMFDRAAFIDFSAGFDEFRPGEGSARSGAAAGKYLDAAVELLREKINGFLVTGPIHKQYFREAGYRYKGHTDYLEEKTGSRVTYMMFASGGLKLILLTHHIPIKDVPSEVTENKLFELLEFVKLKGSGYGIDSSLVAVTGLNPHAGEAGHIGDEELEEIIPAVERARRSGMHIEGPLPADAIFRPDVRGKYTLIITMYHDQGLTAIKALGPSVNITIGLPFIRVSVDHGTAFDIAGRGIADEASAIQAFLVGCEMYENSMK